MNGDDHQRIGLIGDPVEHSLSPAFQQPAFDALGLRIRYELWRTPAHELADRAEEIRQGHALGANVTVPHKEAAFALMDDVSPVARRAGAINTISRQQGRLVGDNTDVYGFIVPLTEHGFDFPSSPAVVIGAGGAARAVAVALLDAGIGQLTIVNRTPERAEAIVRALDDPRLSAGGLDQVTEAARGASLLVNATAIGWLEAQLPVDQDVFGMLAPGAITYDLTYRETAFLRAGRDAGLATIDGLPMLVHQGARSFEIWTGLRAPVDLMWRAALDARARRGR